MLTAREARQGLPNVHTLHILVSPCNCCTKHSQRVLSSHLTLLSTIKGTIIIGRVSLLRVPDLKPRYRLPDVRTAVIVIFLSLGSFSVAMTTKARHDRSRKTSFKSNIHFTAPLTSNLTARTLCM